MHSTYRGTALGVQDRAAAVTRAILLIFSTAVHRWFSGQPLGLSAVRAEIEAVLREEFADIARMTRDEIRPMDE